MINDSRLPVVEELSAVYLTGEIVRLRWTADGCPICPVCGLVFHAQGEASWRKSGQFTEGGLPIVQPTWGICPDCNTEFGEDDVPARGESLELAWANLRREWLAKVGGNAEVLARIRLHLGLEA